MSFNISRRKFAAVSFVFLFFLGTIELQAIENFSADLLIMGEISAPSLHIACDNFFIDEETNEQGNKIKEKGEGLSLILANIIYFSHHSLHFNPLSNPHLKLLATVVILS